MKTKNGLVCLRSAETKSAFVGTSQAKRKAE